jgi:hypothetical protein
MTWTPRQTARATKSYYVQFRRWYINQRRDQILHAININEATVDGVRRTAVTIKQVIPFASRRGRYLVTTTPQRVTSSDVGAEAEEVNRAAGGGVDSGSGLNRRAGKGRVIFLLDLKGAGQPVFAALAFHIADSDEPPLVRCFAGECGADGTATERSIVGMLLLKAYAHALSWKLGGRGYLDARPTTDRERNLLVRLGFKPARSMPGGTYRQAPFVPFVR